MIFVILRRYNGAAPDPGIVSFTFRHEFEEDVPATLDLIKEMGITNIEFSNLIGKTAGEMRELLDQRGMICTSYGVGLSDLLEDLDRVAEEAEALLRAARQSSVEHIYLEDEVDDVRKSVPLSYRYITSLTD